MAPLPFVWPYAIAFWTPLILLYSKESRIVKLARESAKRPGSPDAGSTRILTGGMMLAMAVGLPLAWLPAAQFSASSRLPLLVVGFALAVAGGLLRRHCFKALGRSFTGDVQVSDGQRVVTTGAYSILRHPSYTGGLLMNGGIGIALGSWASLALLVSVTLAVYMYRISVEERALLDGLGEPYAAFMKSRKRLIPFIY